MCVITGRPPCFSGSSALQKISPVLQVFAWFSNHSYFFKLFSFKGPLDSRLKTHPPHTSVKTLKNAERRIPGLAGSLHRPKGASHFQHIQVPSEYLQIPPSWRAAECCSLATSIKLLTRAPWTISSHCRKSNLLFSSATASGWRRLPSPGTGWHHTPISTSGATLSWAWSSTPSRRWPVSTVLEAARPQCTWAIYMCVCGY